MIRGCEPDLAGVFAAYRGQTCGPDAFEIIVAGTDEPAVASPAAGAVPGLSVRVVRRAHATRAAALNSALDAASAKIVMITSDEFLPAPGCIAAHLVFHKEWALDTWATVGKIDSSDARAAGAHDHPADGEIIPHLRFQAGNLSLKRQIIGDDRFDDAFSMDPWMDVDLGYRLRSVKGMQLKYLAAAVCALADPFDPEQVVRRARISGWYELMFYEKHDQLLDPGPIRDIFSHARHALSLLWTFFSSQASFRRRVALARLRGHWRQRLGHPAE